MSRRIKVIPFNATITAEEKKPEYRRGAFWRSQLPGIFNWAVAGLRRLEANNCEFTASAAIVAASEEHRLDSDPARRFLVENYEAAADAKPIAAGELYTAYRNWCYSNGVSHHVAASTFGKQIRRVFPRAVAAKARVSGENVHVWRGLVGRKESPLSVPLTNAETLTRLDGSHHVAAA